MNLITDRTKSDVLLGTEKGLYGVNDLNRVEGAVAELITLAKSLDVNCDLTVKTDWGLPGEFSAEKWPVEGQMQRYLSNVNRLCQAMELVADLPSGMEHLTWEGANKIEQALQAVYKRIRSILQILQFSGELFAGEENRI